MLNIQWALGLTQHSKKETETPHDQAEKTPKYLTDMTDTGSGKFERQLTREGLRRVLGEGSLDPGVHGNSSAHTLVSSLLIS